MSKVLTFSRTYPAYHPKAGQPTYFVEKIWHSLHRYTTQYDLCTLNPDKEEIVIDIYDSFNKTNHNPPKHHTIRAGNHFKVGDKFSPRVWSGKPYASKQIIIAPDIEVKKVYSFSILPWGGYECNMKNVRLEMLKEIALNDGFDDYSDLECWFNVKNGGSWYGQIICWSDSVNY